MECALCQIDRNSEATRRKSIAKTLFPTGRPHGAPVAFPVENLRKICQFFMLNVSPSGARRDHYAGNETGIHVSDRDQAASAHPLALALPESRNRPARADLKRLRRPQQA